MEVQTNSSNQTKPKMAIGSEIGRGGFGIVYRGTWDDGRGVLPAAFKRSVGPPKVFAEEVNLLRTFQLDNLFLLKFLGTASDEFFEYIVLELCDGTLSEFFRSGASAPVDTLDSRSILGQLVVALSYLHGNDIIHKDLKPGNVLYQKTASDFVVWKLSDFGFSRKLKPNQSDFSCTQHLGTDGYIAPELWESDTPSFASDVWALGAVAYFVVSGGRHPYDVEGMGMGQQHLRQTLIYYLKTAPALNAIADDWAASDLIFRLLHYKAECRPSIFTVLYHPFFTLQSDRAKRFLAVKISDFALHYDYKNGNRLGTFLCKQELLKWHENFAPDLAVEGDQADVERMTVLLKQMNLKIPAETNTPQKIRQEISVQLVHSEQLKNEGPIFNEILKLFELGSTIFPLYLFHVLNSISTDKAIYKKYFQVPEAEYCLGFMQSNQLVELWDRIQSPGTELGHLLKMAVLLNRPESLHFLSERGADVEWQDQWGLKPVHYALLSPNVQVLKTLFAKGCDVNAVDSFGRAPLHYASGGHFREVLELLLENGADLKAVDRNGDSPLHLAASLNQSVDIIQFLLDQGADLHARGFHGRTPILQAAANNSNPKVLEFLVDRGAELNDIDMNGDSALHLAACTNQNVDIIQFLLDQGADFHARGFSGRTPTLGAAALNPNPNVLEMLVERGGNLNDIDKNGDSALLLAASFNRNVDIIQFLLDGGADPHAPDLHDRTPILRAAARNPDPKVLELLVERGAELKSVDKNGDSALHLASSFNWNVQVIQFLLDRCADLHASDTKGRTAILRAAEQNANPKVLELLLENGADLKNVDKDGNSVLHLAAGFNRNVQVIQLLLDGGADLRARGFHGRTPILEAAANSCNPKVLEFLVERGADLKDVDSKGNSALHLAAGMNENIEVMQFLLDRGADLHARNNFLLKPISLARLNDNPKALELLQAAYERSTGGNSTCLVM